MTCLEINVNYKMKLSLEGKIGITNVADTLDIMVQDINPDLNPNMYTAVIILVVMSVSTVTTERSFSAMRRLMNYLPSTVTPEGISGLAWHIHKDISPIVKNRRLALLFRPE